MALPENIQPGYYVLVMQTDDKTMTEKILVVK